MSLNEEDDVKPRPEFWEKAVIGLAAMLTLAALGAAYFLSVLPPTKPAVSPPAQPRASEVSIGIFPSKPPQGH
jgi:hypothetical protein